MQPQRTPRVQLTTNRARVAHTLAARSQRGHTHRTHHQPITKTQQQQQHQKTHRANYESAVAIFSHTFSIYNNKIKNIYSSILKYMNKYSSHIFDIYTDRLPSEHTNRVIKIYQFLKRTNQVRCFFISKKKEKKKIIHKAVGFGSTRYVVP